jgi:proteasome lid subunit RPN8/RPN11
MPKQVEECWTLIGRCRGRVWLARRVRYRVGVVDSVCADGPWTLAREEKRGDVIGFMHTHPNGPARPSARDVRTMRAWCDALGKPLLCAIATPRGLVAYRFDGHASRGRPLAVVEMFEGDVIIGVDHAGKVPPRADLPRPRRDRAAGRGAAHAVRGRRAGVAAR